ncbi:MAG: DEAD/DEAH box helicase family protein [Firmicutes bacterium]|nr:DEAD/DEAH box helicase family protein [Bacillota bacterium]
MTDFRTTHFKWTFRDYQQAILDNAAKHLKDKKIHIVAAPGSGKTILGLELIRRLNAPALVMSPSVTIRQQWGERFVESFLPNQANPDDYISYNLFAPSLITSITYQALHAAFTKKELLSDSDEDELEAEASQDFSQFDLMQTIKNAGITTICLDEAHHLKSEWQRALEKFIALLGDQVTVISLTATPPYDSTPAEWERYSALCGDIDEEIFVPQLVIQKTLCPHQDYLYFNYPTAEETTAITTYQQKTAACTHQIL